MIIMNDQKIAILIKKLALEFDKIAIPALRPYGLTPTQFKTLKYLYEHENVIGTDIQNAFSMTNPTVTGILQNMENTGWIQRESSTTDLRSKVIKLAKKSIDKKAELYELGNSLEVKFTKSLTKNEQDKLLPLLNKIMKGIKEWKLSQLKSILQAKKIWKG